MNRNKYEEALGNAAKKVYERDFDSIEFNKDLEYIELDINDIQNKVPNRRGHLTIAASILTIIFLSGAFGLFISNGSVSAAKFNIEKQFVKLENLNKSGTENYKKYVEDGNIIQEIGTVKDIGKAADFFPDLFIVDHMPERFHFQSLVITKSADDFYNAVYVYQNNDGQILTIIQLSISEEGSSVSLVGITDEVRTEKGTIYISENPFGDGGNSGSYIKNHYSVSIAGKIDKDEIIGILND